MYFPSSNTPEYRQGNSDAHRVRPANFRAPALISHYAFWIYSARQDDRTNLRERIKTVIDNVIVQTAQRAKNHDANTCITPSIGGLDILFASFAEAGRFDVDPGAKRADRGLDLSRLNLGQRALFESDHRVVSLQFRWQGCDVTVRFEFMTEYFSVTTIAEIAACTIPGVLVDVARINAFDLENKEADIQARLFDVFWRAFSDQICPQQLLANDAFKHVFADFRGIVVANDALLDRAGNSAAIEALLPLLGSARTPQGYECSVSSMLDGQALHMTALGPQLTAYVDESRVPVTYLLAVASGLNRWQRGRLVDLIHTAETSRLAALRDLAALRGAGNSLAGMDHYTARARNAVSEHRHLAEGEPPTLDVAQCIDQAHGHFNAITKTFNEGAGTDYGLSYRVERSRYYVDRFKENVAGMSLARIEGYNKYDDFVQQRLGATFDYIDRLGRRYERAVGALSLLDGYHLTIQSNEIALSQKEIALSQKDEEAEEADVNKKTLEIQVVGDFVLFAALLPYYATALLEHLYGGEGRTATEHMEMFTALIWSAAFMVAIYRSIVDTPARKVGRAGVLLIAMWISIWTSAQALDWGARYWTSHGAEWCAFFSGWLAKLFPAF